MKKNSKKITLTIGIILAATLSFAGCGKKSPEQELENAIQTVFEEIDKGVEKISEEKPAGESAGNQTITIDPFDPAVFGVEGGIEVMYEGIAPEGVPYISYGSHSGGAYVNEVYREDPYKAVCYQIEGVGEGSYGGADYVMDGYSFTEGGELTVTASLREEAADAGIELSSTRTTLTLTGAAYRLRNAADLDPYLADIAALVTENFAENTADSVEFDGGETIFGGLGDAHDKRLGALYLEKRADGTPTSRIFVSCCDSMDGMAGWETEGMTFSDLVCFYEFNELSIGRDGKLRADCMWNDEDGWEIVPGASYFPFVYGRFQDDGAGFAERMLRQYAGVEDGDELEMISLPGGGE